MSGRKQHFIPQSLLKGFATTSTGKKAQVVVYRFGGKNFVAATDGIGAERHFYSELDVDGSEETLDDKITDHETSISEVLDALRSAGDGQVVGSGNAAALVTHLVIRNDHFRKTAKQAGGSLFSRFRSAMADRESAASLLGLDSDKPNDLFRKKMDELWLEQGGMFRAMGLTRDTLTAFAFNFAKQNFAQFHAQMLAPMESAFSDASGRITEIAADSQIKALDQSLTPEKWLEKLEPYRWTTRDVGFDCLLPDCVAICFDTDGRSFPVGFADDEARKCIVMPIASRRVLVGMAKEDRVLRNLNFSLARCCWDFFVAAEKSEPMLALGGEIRIHMEAYIDDLAKTAIEDVRKE